MNRRLKLEMRAIFYVGAGSFIGGILRYALSAWIYKILSNPWFPYGTLAVNTLGCLAIGFLAGLGETRGVFTPDARLFLFVGLLGGFTTFSSVALETLWLARGFQSLAAVSNIGLQLFLGLMAVWIGNLFGRLVGA
jgi:CrcB protein